MVKTSLIVALGVFLFLVGLLFASSAMAADFFFYIGDSGPHNHNGNSTMDFYWNDDFGGSMRLVIEDINNTRGSASMPKARRVYSKSAADIVVVRDPEIRAGRFTHTPNPDKPDVIRIGWGVDGGSTGERVYIHEAMHGYSLQHISSVYGYRKCANINYRSVMCNHSPQHLTRYDNWNLRQLDNKWTT